MSIEYRKNEVKNKATGIYTDVHRNLINTLTYTEIDKVKFYLTQIEKILHKEV